MDSQKDIEIIISDNISNDSSVEIAIETLKKNHYNKILVIRNHVKNIGNNYVLSVPPVLLSAVADFLMADFYKLGGSK